MASPAFTAIGTPARRCIVAHAAPRVAAVLNVVVHEKGVVQHFQARAGGKRVLRIARPARARSRCTARAADPCLTGRENPARARTGAAAAPTSERPPRACRRACRGTSPGAQGSPPVPRRRRRLAPRRRRCSGIAWRLRIRQHRASTSGSAVRRSLPSSRWRRRSGRARRPTGLTNGATLFEQRARLLEERRRTRGWREPRPATSELSHGRPASYRAAS